MPWVGSPSVLALLRLPIGGGLAFRRAGTWPRTNALFCYPMPPAPGRRTSRSWCGFPLRSCVRRGAAIEVVADRARENRSQLEAGRVEKQHLPLSPQMHLDVVHDLPLESVVGLGTPGAFIGQFGPRGGQPPGS
jgi:hypothetical protein